MWFCMNKIFPSMIFLITYLLSCQETEAGHNKLAGMPPQRRSRRQTGTPVPIDCQLSQWSEWTQCFPCQGKKYRYRTLLQPSKYAGRMCTGSLWDQVVCEPTERCAASQDCENDFRCEESGRCIKRHLVCNGEADCRDESDEANCEDVESLCDPLDPIPGIGRIAQGYNSLTQKGSQFVYDTSYYGGQCESVYNGEWRELKYDATCEHLYYGEDEKYFRKPYNIHYYQFLAYADSDFSSEYFDDATDLLNALKKDTSSNFGLTVGVGPANVPISLELVFTLSRGKGTLRNATQYQSKNLGFIRVRTKVQTARFKMRRNDVVLDEDLFQSLMDLPDQYNYGMYAEFINTFGTHFMVSGTMGGIFEYILVINKDKLHKEEKYQYHLKMSKQKRKAYKVAFKLEAIEFAKEHGNRAAARHFGPPPTEKMIREWRKQEDQLQKLNKSKHTLRGPAAKWPELEMEVKEWITHHRQNGLSVSTSMVIYEAKRIAVEKGIQDFTGSPSWCYRFMKRSGLSMRTKTRIAQQMPKEYESKILSFHKFVIDARKKNNFEISQIGNMDEVPLTFDVPSNRTVDTKGAKTITVKTSGHEKTHYTVVLSCCADGTKLLPMLIFKRKTFPKETIPRGVVVHVHDKGWMDENGMRLWIDKVWSKRPGGLLKKSSLLVLDQFRAHITENTKKNFKEVKTQIAVIPGGLTCQLQPLDVSINKPFKVLMREEWNTWMAAGNHDLTPTGRMKRPTITQVCEWVKRSWDSVKKDIVVKSFKKCGISNALDGTEDDALFDTSGEESDDNDCEDLSFLVSDSSEEEQFLGFE